MKNYLMLALMLFIISSATPQSFAQLDSNLPKNVLTTGDSIKMSTQFNKEMPKVNLKGIFNYATENFKKNKYSYLLICVSGIVNGSHEVMTHDYGKWSSVMGIPDSKDWFWDPRISSKNKYKNGNPDEGEKYFGSTTFLVLGTDGDHLHHFLERVNQMGAMAFKATIIIGKPLKEQVGDIITTFLFGYASFMVGFNISYYVLMEQPFNFSKK